MTRETLDELEADDYILFNDRKIPLQVEDVDQNQVHIKGPQGGEFTLFSAEDDPELVLVARKGSRRYASKVENLRKTGEWNKVDENIWKHTKSGQVIELVKNNAGFWTIKTELEADAPKYGYSSREFAVEDVKNLMKQNPEG